MPLTCHIEVTEFCNERCRHCYNFDRDKRRKNITIDWQDLENILDELEPVKHIIVTGGEPLVALDETLYLIKESIARGKSVSLNSNLIAAPPRVAKLLKESGLEHVLTTLHSYKDEVHDYIANTPGALKKVKQGITNMVEAGIRVSANLVLNDLNKKDVYETGFMAKSLGVTKFMVNRMIPKSAEREDILEAVNDLLRLKSTGLEVATCRNLPECMFDDLKKYSDFIGRGCAAGKRQLVVSVDGSTRACVHEQNNYGNIYEVGLDSIWSNMKYWRSPFSVKSGCYTCPRFDTCEGGCKLIVDNLCRGKEYVDTEFEGAGSYPSKSWKQRSLQEKHS